MKAFSISRLETTTGVYRISGMIMGNIQNKDAIKIEKLHILSTDGYIAISLDNNAVIANLTQLKRSIAEHLS